MKLIIELPEFWGPADICDVANHLRADTMIKTDRDTLAKALEQGLDLDALMEAVRKS